MRKVLQYLLLASVAAIPLTGFALAEVLFVMGAIKHNWPLPQVTGSLVLPVALTIIYLWAMGLSWALDEWNKK